MKQKKLSIIFLDFDDIRNPLLAAGQAKATQEVGSRMAKQGHTVTVICSRYPGYKDRKEFGMHYQHIGLGSKNIRLNNLMYILLLPFTVMRLKADIIIECFTAPISTLFSPLFTKVPVVALPTSFEATRFAKLYHFPTDKIERIGLRVYKYFLPFMQSNLERMQEVNPDIIYKIVPEGVGDEFFKIKKQKPEFILFLGRLDMGQKGIDLLLNAYKKIEQKISYPLVIVGNGPDEKKIQQLIGDLKLAKKVTMVGPAYGKEKAEYLKKALFVAFSSRHEGFSLFSLEAIASQNMMVGFDIPGLSYAPESIVMKAKPFSVDDYAAKLLLAANPKTAASMGKAAREYARQYTWDNVANSFLSFFYEILAKRKEILPK